MNNKALAYTAYVVAAILLVLAVMYFMTPANQLPSFLPGHDTTTKTHIKHGVASVLLALAAIAFGRFQTGPKSVSSTSQED